MKKVSSNYDKNKEPDWLSVQFKSFERFFSKDKLSIEFSLERILKPYRSIALAGDHELSIDSWKLFPPEMSPEECLLSNQNYCQKLWFNFSIRGPLLKGQEYKFSQLVAEVLVPTPDDEFIKYSKSSGNANRYSMVMQLALSPGVYYTITNAVHKCKIYPARGRKIYLRYNPDDKQNKYSFLMGGLKINLISFKEFLQNKNKLDVLLPIYRYLERNELLASNQILPPSAKFSTEELLFVRDVFRQYITSFDMSTLGKKQLYDNIGSEICLTNSNLSEFELIYIIDSFIEEKIPESDDRSLKCRKVKLIGDFLFEHIEWLMQFIKGYIQEEWKNWCFNLSKRRIRKKSKAIPAEGTEESSKIAPDVNQAIRNIIPSQYFVETIKNFFRYCELFQLLDHINPLAEISQKRRLTFRGPGGVPEKYLFLEKRDVHPTDFGRLCPIESPQGENLGFNLYLAQDARVNELGLIEARFIDIKTGKELFCDPYGEEKLITAVKVGADRQLGENIYVKTKDEELKLSDGKEITHSTSSRHNFIGYASALIPFLQHNDANRALMGANMMKQALQLRHPEPPIIKTGLESKIALQLGGNNPFIIEDHLSLGTNLLVGYLPWDLLNYEDGIVISDRLTRQHILTHLEEEEITCDEAYSVGEKNNYYELITKDNQYLATSDVELLNDNGIIREDTPVNLGTVLVSKLRSIRTKAENEKYSHLEELIAAVTRSNPGKKTKDNSFRVLEDISGRVKKVELIKSGLPAGVKRRVRLTIETERPIQVGDKLTGRHGNKGVVAKILPESEMPYFKSQEKKCGDHQCPIQEPHTHLEILLNPLTITGRMNLGQLYETTLGWIAKSQGLQEGFIVPPFDQTWNWQNILQKLGEFGIKEQQTIYYWQDGSEIKLERPVTIGFQYFLKLKHQAAKKMKARDQASYSPAHSQPSMPTKSDPWQRRLANRKTPQRLGEMEVWALEGHSAWNILDEFLSWKSDDENLRQQLMHYIHSIERARNAVHATLQGWCGSHIREVAREGEDFYVTFPKRNKEKIAQLTRDKGLKFIEEAEDNYLFTWKMQYDPVDVLPREHRAFKSLIHYCRAMGLELEGIDDKGNPFKLVGYNSSKWPNLCGVSIYIATNQERKDWAFNQVIASSGLNDKDGLWSNNLFGDLSNPKDGDKVKDSSAIIELAVPIDNPLFRAQLEILLDQKGINLETNKEQLRQLISNLYPGKSCNWEELWDNTVKSRSSLQTKQELLEWLRQLGDAPQNYDSENIANELKKVLPEESWFNLKMIFDPSSYHYLGPEKIYHHCRFIDLGVLKNYLTSLDNLNNIQQRQLDLVELLINKGYSLDHFFIRHLYVLPKSLRFERELFQVNANKDPQYEHDLNYLYRQVLNQNNRVHECRKNTQFHGLLSKEEEKLRQNVYAFLVNEKMKKVINEPFLKKNGQAYQSVLAIISGQPTGKEGIFRKNLLGKRVDYSGRGVIVPNPALGLDEAGLPYKMGKILFKDLLIKKFLENDQEQSTSKNPKFICTEKLIKAKKFLRDNDNDLTVRNWLDDLAKEYLILLNRAPSLHRLSILAFRPRFHDLEDVLKINPYVCAPFNADFDGDTMGIFLPMLPLSQAEAHNMLPSKALRSPGHGDLLINYKADLALACYLMTSSTEKNQEFTNLLGYYGSQGPMKAAQLYELFNSWSANKTNLIKNLSEFTPFLRECLKRSGFSLSVSDFIFDQELPRKINAYEQEAIVQNFSSPQERRIYWENKTTEVESYLTKKISALPANSSTRILVDSGAAKLQLTQISGMRGIMLRPGGDYVSYPVLGNMVNGMLPLEYFVSCHGSRHGLCDKGLMTAPAGDLTNILIQAAQRIFIVEEDCGCQQGIYISSFGPPSARGIPLRKRLIGRYLAEAIVLETGEPFSTDIEITPELAEKIELIGKDRWVKIRSPLTCQGINRRSVAWQVLQKKLLGKVLAAPIVELGIQAEHILSEEDLINIARLRLPVLKIKNEDTQDSEKFSIPAVDGICQKCYGQDLFSNSLPPIGFPAGIIAAQSIGEPGTQLTLKTFHTGGVAGQEISQGLKVAKKAFCVGKVPEELISEINNKAKVLASPSGLNWLEIKENDSSGADKMTILPLINYSIISKYISIKQAPNTYEDRLSKNNNLQEIPLNQILNNNNIDSDINHICKEYGPIIVAEYLLYFLQKIYNANSKVADHHFEVMLYSMMAKLDVIDSKNTTLKNGDRISLAQYFRHSDKPTVKLKSIITLGSESPGFLSRLAFRDTKDHLNLAALAKKVDWITGLKEKVVIGQIRQNSLEGRAT
jgi:DNA-directed RNA polymerase beta subunit/DNA-directed RNA polymerase beta' subunit